MIKLAILKSMNEIHGSTLIAFIYFKKCLLLNGSKSNQTIHKVGLSRQLFRFILSLSLFPDDSRIRTHKLEVESSGLLHLNHRQ